MAEWARHHRTLAEEHRTEREGVHRSLLVVDVLHNRLVEGVVVVRMVADDRTAVVVAVGIVPVVGHRTVADVAAAAEVDSRLVGEGMDYDWDHHMKAVAVEDILDCIVLEEDNLEVGGSHLAAGRANGLRSPVAVEDIALAEGIAPAVEDTGQEVFVGILLQHHDQSI